MVYHPGLASSFEYVVKAQLEEYERLYGAPANRVDGHHHMHLCANVVKPGAYSGRYRSFAEISLSGREKKGI